MRAVGSFAGRADDLINLRGIKMFPVQIEEAVRAIAGIGDEFEIVLATNADGLDVMTVRVEHHAGDEIAAAVADEIRTPLRSALRRRGAGARHLAEDRVQGGAGEGPARQIFGREQSRSRFIGFAVFVCAQVSPWPKPQPESLRGASRPRINRPAANQPGEAQAAAGRRG